MYKIITKYIPEKYTLQNTYEFISLLKQSKNLKKIIFIERGDLVY